MDDALSSINLQFPCNCHRDAYHHRGKESVPSDNQWQANFILPSGSYRFQATHDRQPFWSGDLAITPDQTIHTTISTGGGSYVLTVTDGTTGLAGIKTILFSPSGSYLNQSVITSASGEAAYNLANGDYRVTADYLGYEYSTGPFTGPLTASQTLAIPHQTHTVSVFRAYQNDRIPVANAEVTLGTVDGTPLALNALTGAEGTVQWSLPVQSYTVQARYLGRAYRSDAFTSGDPDVLIPEGLARVTLRQGGAALPNTQITAISDTDPDHPRYLTTDASGEALFRLPAGSYTFKATLSETVYQGVGTVVADQITDITLNLGTSTLTITVRKDDATVLPGVVTLLGRNFISMEGEDLDTLTIELGTMTVTVRDDSLVSEGNSEGRVQGAVVELFTAEGTPLGQELSTGADGQVCFTLPEGSYTLRVSYNGQQFWSYVIHTSPFGDTPVDMVNGQGGVMSLLHDPRPPLWHGTPPEHRPLLALASGSLAGMLTAASTPIADTPQVFYYLNDHLGTAQLIVDAARTVVWQGDTQPFGQVTEAINQLDHRFRFPGQMLDPESGLYYNWHRFYDPETGRYLSADPIELAGGMDLYAYVGGNPVNWADPWGLAPCCDAELPQSPIKEVALTCFAESSVPFG